MGNSWNMLNFQ